MKRSLKAVCSAIFAFAYAHFAIAQSPIPPTSGLWWVPGVNGKFMQLDVGPGGYALATLSFDDDDAPTYRVLQGALEPVVNPIDGIAQLRSPLYRVDQAGCLECDDSQGVTSVDDPRIYSLRFSSGTTAELQTGSGERIRYEFYPLLTQQAELTGERLRGKRAVLRRGNAGALVNLRPTTLNPDCADPLFGSEQIYAVDIQTGAPQGGLFNPYLQGMTLVVEQSHNPKLVLLSRQPIVERRCVLVTFGSCAQYEFEEVGSRCVTVANLVESDHRLIGNTEFLQDPYWPTSNNPLEVGRIELTVLD